MRVLVTTTPGRGHYHPMLPLAQAIAARGHELLWVASDQVCERLRAHGFDAPPAAEDLPEPASRWSRSWPFSPGGPR